LGDLGQTILPECPEQRQAIAQFVVLLGQLDLDQAHLIDELEERRRELEEARMRSTGAAITAEDEGLLTWPVEGSLIYRFGRDERPNGTVLRWNGVGISARTGTPVHAVKSGTVVLAGPFAGYGPTVVLSHGDGFYTLYLYLEDIGVVEGREVEEGQVVGTVGGADTPEGPHIEFQIRAPLDGDTPQAQDPLRWLRPPGR
jgi:septal ring factor EnvC (AmiA/AmiB activator)